MYDQTDEEFTQLYYASKSWTEFGRRLGAKCEDGRLTPKLKTKATILGLDMSHMKSKAEPRVISDNIIFEKYVLESTCVNHVIEKHNYQNHLSNRTKIYARIESLGLSIAHWKCDRKMTSKFSKICDTDFERMIAKSTCATRVSILCGYHKQNSIHLQIMNRIKSLNLDISHWKTTYSTEKLLVKNSPMSQTSIKRRLIKEGILKYECSGCSEGDLWRTREDGVLLYNEIPVNLQLDHVNGDNRDNRTENLRYLCGTCHSQTDTFCGKNTKKARKSKKWVHEGTTHINKKRKLVDLEAECI
jgi:hypothetical protein